MNIRGKTVCIVCVSLFLVVMGTTIAQSIDTTTVRKFDLTKFLGTWYEFARFPHKFEKDLVGVTATYKIRPDGRIDVINKGYKNSLSGKQKISEGVARRRKDGRTAELEVSFFFIFYSDYNILEIDDSYSYALIGSSSPDYLWILSRKPTLDNAIYNKLLQKAEARGYDISKIERVEQPK